MLALESDGSAVLVRFRAQTWVLAGNGRLSGRLHGIPVDGDPWSNDGKEIVTDLSPPLDSNCGRRTRHQLSLGLSSASGVALRTIAALTPREAASHLARDSSIDAATWSPDSSEVAYAVREWTCGSDIPTTIISVADTHTGTTHVLYRPTRTSTRNDYAGDPTWSPDGTQVVVADDCEVGSGCNRLTFIDTRTLQTRSIKMRDPIGTNVAWTNGGNVIVGAAVDDPEAVTRIGAFDTRTGAIRWLLHGACLTWLDGPTIKLSRDGTRALLADVGSGCSTHPRFFVISLDGSGASRRDAPNALSDSDAVLP